MSSDDPIAWPATRFEGLRKLEEFVPRAGRDYGEVRNFDLGPADRTNVSTLSPYLRHRLILESEVVAAVIARHGSRTAEKFVQEACWRTYWKGWLELRPSIWTEYRSEIRDQVQGLSDDESLRDRYDRATTGRSGIGCLDQWSSELIEHGYLHNHARMWFASLWIFTLKLPWALGADFFLRHLIDGDPASNTLSWRWVAGLQTRGKTYLARPDNIARFTNGRIKPREPMANLAEPLPGANPPPVQPLPAAGVIDPAQPFGLLLTEEDLAPETLGLTRDQVQAVAGVLDLKDRSPLPIGQRVLDFGDGALTDALDRAGRTFEVASDRLEGDWSRSVEDWARGLNLNQVVTAHAPVGPARERLDQIEPALRTSGIRLIRVRRAWDEELWPHATAGYFGFKKKLESSLTRLGIFDRVD